MTFVYPLFRREEKDSFDKEDEIVRRIKRRIEVRWGLYCVLALLVWIVLIAGIVVLIEKTVGSKGGDTKSLAARWVTVAHSSRGALRIFY